MNPYSMLFCFFFYKKSSDSYKLDRKSCRRAGTHLSIRFSGGFTSSARQAALGPDQNTTLSPLSSLSPLHSNEDAHRLRLQNSNVIILNVDAESESLSFIPACLLATHSKVSPNPSRKVTARGGKKNSLEAGGEMRGGK